MCIGTFFITKNATIFISRMAKSINFDAKNITKRVLHKNLYFVKEKNYEKVFKTDDEGPWGERIP